MEIHCPYHSYKWRSVSQHIINHMRSNKLLKSTHIRRIPSVVCACPDKSGHSLNLPQLPVHESIIKWSDGLVKDSSFSKIHSSVKRYIAASDASNISESYKQSLDRMLGVIYLVCHGTNNFLLPPPLQSTTETPTEQFEYKEDEFFLSIPVIPVTYIGNLIGTKGTYLKALCSKYHIKSVHLGETETSSVQGTRKQRARYINSDPIKVTYKYDDNDNAVLAGQFKKALEERAQEVRKKRQHHYVNVQRFQTMRKIRAQEWREKRNLENTNYADLLDCKEGVSLGQQKHKNKDKDKQKVKPLPILEDSKCLHCQQPHSTKTKECTYHPGYIAEVKRKGKKTKRWTCCDKYYRNSENLIMEHARTGCTFGLHIWRPVSKNQKKKSKPATNNKDQTEDVIVTTQKKT